MILRKAIFSIVSICLAFSGAIAHAQGLALLRDAEIEQFLDDYSRPIFKAARLPEDSIEILIVNDGSFNAFAGGRYMGVNTGMLTTVETPNQLEAVIAHEAGHLAGGHSARTADAIAAASRPMLLSLLLAGAAVAAGAPDVGFAVLGLGQTVGRANFLQYSRGQESTADQSSITYLDEVGHSSKGALELWRKMRNFQIITGKKINPYEQSHPLANARQSALQRRAEASPYFHVTDPPEEIERLRYIQAKIRGFLHDPVSTLRKYPLTDTSGPAYYARALAYFRNAKIDLALLSIRKLTEEHPDNPYFHELEGQMLFEFGRTEEAIAPYERSIAILSDNALLRVNLGRALLASSNPLNHERSIAEFKTALLIEPDNGFGWFELARAYGAVGNEPMALLATAESRYHAGAKADANQFARRAMGHFSKDSQEWRQASDIILATMPDDEEAPDEIDTTPLPKPETEELPSKKRKEKPDVPDPTFISTQADASDNF